MTTTESRTNNFELIVALDEAGTASGELYWDDGIRIDDEMNFGTLMTYQASNNQVSSTVVLGNYPELALLSMEKISIWGVSGSVNEIDVQVNGGAVSCSYNTDIDKVLNIDCGNQISAMDQWTITWTVGVE